MILLLYAHVFDKEHLAYYQVIFEAFIKPDISVLCCQDYMEDIHAKEIPLIHTTVKIPGQRPRGSRTTSVGCTNQPDGGDMNNSTGVLKLFLACICVCKQV